MKIQKNPPQPHPFNQEITNNGNFHNESFVDSGHYSGLLPEHALILHHLGISTNTGSFLINAASKKDFFNVNMLIEGSLRLTGTQEKILKEGDIFFSEDGDGICVADDKSKKARWIYFSLYRTMGAILFKEQSTYRDEKILHVPEPEIFTNILWKIADLLKANTASCLPKISSLLYEFFTTLNYTCASPVKISSWDILFSRIRRPPFTSSVSHLAAEMGLPVRIFSRKFKEHFGIPPKKYLSESRLTYASYLLIQEHYAISEIATLCGYTDSAHFIHEFKEYAGSSPDQYRKMKKEIPSAFQHRILFAMAGSSITETKSGSKVLSSRRQEILYLLKHNNKLSQRKLAKTLHINVSAVEAHLSYLKKNGFLKRKGSARGGYWEITAG